MKTVAIGVLMILFGAGAIWASRQASATMRRSRDWPTTPGHILERGVGEAMSQARVYMPHVKYAYSVGGRDLINDQVYAIRGTGDLKPAIEKLVDALPDPVPVHYNPKDPAEAYLLSNPMATYWILVAFGIGAIVLGAMTVLTGLLRS